MLAADLSGGDAAFGASGAWLLALGWLLAGVAAAFAAALVLVVRRLQGARARVAELQQRARELERDRDAALNADREKSRFLAIASHDLRQPVHAIGLFVATLQNRLAGHPEEPLIRNLGRAIDGLDRSFGVMLDISRLNSGAVEPRPQRFPVGDLFRRLHLHFSGQAELKGLGLRFSTGGKSITSDPQLLERILANLVHNAIKYTETGGIVVVARSTATHHHLEVWDTGIGIREADLPKVFDEFFQVGRGRVRSDGLGLGLSIVQRLARLLGHELTVASRVGRGTRFRVAISRGRPEGVAPPIAPGDTLPMHTTRARTVLVLEDDAATRQGLEDLLQQWGYGVIVSDSLADACRAVRGAEAPPDLLVADLQLDDAADGIAAIDALHRECGSDVPAILLTGDTTHDKIRRATESGHQVLVKPVQPGKLYDALRGL